jgi:K+-sensing histidine kinase KdpD
VQHLAKICEKTLSNRDRIELQFKQFLKGRRGTTSETVGVFVVQPKKKSRKLELDTESLLLSIVRQLGVSIEKHFLTERFAETQRLKDSEELHQTLLKLISHEI